MAAGIVSTSGRYTTKSGGVSDNQPVSGSTEQVNKGGNLVLKPAPLELAEQPRSEEGVPPGTDTVSQLLPVVLPGTAPESRQSEGPPRRDRQETTGTRPESGEAIVVGRLVQRRVGFSQDGPTKLKLNL